MAPIRLGFVGLSGSSWAATTLVPPLLEPPLTSQYSLTAVSTTNEASANASAEKYSKLVSEANQTESKLKAYWGSTEKIANDPDVDMVAISVRTPFHVETASKVLEAKKDIFIEWPAGNQLNGTIQLAELARRFGVRTLVGFQTRQADYVTKIKEIVDSGALGRILATSVVVSFCFPGVRGPKGFAHHQYLSQASNGATMLDIDGGHLVDVLIYLFGPIKSIVSHLATQYSTIQPYNFNGEPTGDPIPQDDVHQVVFGGSFSNGAVLSVNIRLTDNNPGLFWVIDGEKGSLKVQGDGENGRLSFMRAQPDVYHNGKKLAIEKDSENQRAARNWKLFAEKQEGKYPTLEDALRVKTVINAVWTSHREGRRVEIDV